MDADEIRDARLGEDVTRNVHDEHEEEEDEDDDAGQRRRRQRRSTRE